MEKKENWLSERVDELRYTTGVRVRRTTDADREFEKAIEEARRKIKLAIENADSPNGSRKRA